MKKMTWTESAKWAALSALVFVFLAVLVNLATGYLTGLIGAYALGVFTCNLFVYRFDLYGMLPK